MHTHTDNGFKKDHILYQFFEILLLLLRLDIDAISSWFFDVYFNIVNAMLKILLHIENVEWTNAISKCRNCWETICVFISFLTIERNPVEMQNSYCCSDEGEKKEQQNDKTS